MGSLRNPIGPLPSSIYWRRRGVALGVLALLALLAFWLFSFGGGGGSKDSSDGSSDGKGGPAETTITPGPTPSGPHYSQRPGGRGDSGGGGDTGGGSGGAAGRGGGGGGVVAGGFGGGPGLAVSTDGKAVLSASKLPDCAPGSVKLAVRSVKDSYGPGEKPKFEVVVENTGGSACKVDFGAAAAQLKITNTVGDDHVWASDDCPRGTSSLFVELPGSGETKRTLEWDRKRSVPQCATPSGSQTAGPGTYRVEVKVAGVTEKVDFKLEQ
ncbi:hypothetical protein ACMATS_16800 [Streptoverticillium reticulum]|uniref:hypothetical protein n=1 Tax=Streptoverticillium reticulum TaxID=1433415 RepID=UPI0039BEEBCD